MNIQIIVNIFLKNINEFKNDKRKYLYEIGPRFVGEKNKI